MSNEHVVLFSVSVDISLLVVEDPQSFLSLATSCKAGAHWAYTLKETGYFCYYRAWFRPPFEDARCDDNRYFQALIHKEAYGCISGPYKYHRQAWNPLHNMCLGGARQPFVMRLCGNGSIVGLFHHRSLRTFRDFRHLPEPSDALMKEYFDDYSEIDSGTDSFDAWGEMIGHLEKTLMKFLLNDRFSLGSNREHKQAAKLLLAVMKNGEPPHILLPYKKKLTQGKIGKALNRLAETGMFTNAFDCLFRRYDAECERPYASSLGQ